MPLPVVANVIRVAVRGQCSGGGQWVNVHHVEDNGGTNFPDALITTLHAALTGLYSPAGLTGTPGVLALCTAATVTLDAQYIRLDGITATQTRAMALAGTMGGDSLPAQNAIVATLRTGIRGRRARGRIYLPPFGEGQSDLNGRLPASSVTALNTLFGKHIAALQAAGMDWVVCSYIPPATPRTITTVEVNGLYDVQRRRKS